jgi:hypothetical protein
MIRLPLFLFFSSIFFFFFTWTHILSYVFNKEIKNVV